MVADLAATAPDDVRVVGLEALDDEHAAQLVSEISPAMGVHAVADVVARAGGLPLWCALLARGERGAADVGTIVHGRLAGVGDDARALAIGLVVLSRPCHPGQLARIERWEAGQLHDALSQLDDAGLVTWDSDGRVTVHHLLHSAVAANVGDEACRSTHRKVADWLEAEASSRNDVAFLLEACRHRQGAGLDVGELVEAIVDSPSRRLLGLDGLDVLVALVDQLQPSPADDVGVRRSIARLAGELGRHGVALEGWRYVAERSADPTTQTEAWIAGCLEAQHLEELEEATACLARARRSAPAGDEMLQIEIDLAAASMERWRPGRGAEAEQLTARALVRLAALEDPQEVGSERARRAHLRGLTLSSLAAQQRGDADEMLEIADLIAQAATGFDVSAFVDVQLRAGSGLMLAGRLREARRRLQAALREARRAVLPDKVLDAGSWLLWTTILMGDLQQAASVAEECRALVARLDEHSRPASLIELYSTELELSCGDRDAAFGRLRELMDKESDPHFRLGIRRTLALWSARVEAADSMEVYQLLREARADANAAGCARCASELVLTGMEALMRIGAEHAAAEWAGDPAAQHSAGGSLLHAWRRERARACFAVLRSSEDAKSLLERAVESADAIGLAVEATWTRIDLAQMLADTDAEAAAGILESAHAWALEQGAATERQLIEKRLRTLGRRTWVRGPTAGGAGMAALSPRELEVANFIAAGLSNQAIAERLFLSVKTIERHVSNALTKMGARNRAELAARVASGEPHRTTSSADR